MNTKELDKLHTEIVNVFIKLVRSEVPDGPVKTMDVCIAEFLLAERIVTNVALSIMCLAEREGTMSSAWQRKGPGARDLLGLLAKRAHQRIVIANQHSRDVKARDADKESTEELIRLFFTKSTGIDVEEDFI